MIRIIKLSNRIGFAVNIFGLKVPFVFGDRVGYWDNGILKHKNHWFANPKWGTCQLSTTCNMRYHYKSWRSYGYSFWESIRYALWGLR